MFENIMTSLQIWPKSHVVMVVHTHQQCQYLVDYLSQPKNKTFMIPTHDEV